MLNWRRFEQAETDLERRLAEEAKRLARPPNFFLLALSVTPRSAEHDRLKRARASASGYGRPACSRPSEY
jgi:hypothetical protein